VALRDRLFRDLADGMRDGICLVDGKGRIVYWNKGAKRLTGYSCSEMVGKHASDRVLTHIDSGGSPMDEEEPWLEGAIRNGEVREAQVYFRHKDGHRIPLRVYVGPVRAANGRRVGAVEVFSDNAAMAAALQRIEELETLTLIDALTKLPNRVYVEMSLLARLSELRRYGWTFGMLFIDLDEFKDVNDKYGHDAGDEVLRVVGKTLLENTRPFDVLGRWGGDEFVGAIIYATEEHLGAIAERYRRLIEDLAVPVGSDTVKVTVSMGATLARKEDNVESLYKRADKLMYQSKNGGGNRVSLDGDG